MAAIGIIGAWSHPSEKTRCSPCGIKTKGAPLHIKRSSERGEPPPDGSSPGPAPQVRGCSAAPPARPPPRPVRCARIARPAEHPGKAPRSMMADGRTDLSRGDAGEPRAAPPGHGGRHRRHGVHQRPHRSRGVDGPGAGGRGPAAGHYRQRWTLTLQNGIEYVSIHRTGHMRPQHTNTTTTNSFQRQRKSKYLLKPCDFDEHPIICFCIWP